MVFLLQHTGKQQCATQCCIATVPVGKHHVSRKVSLLYFLFFLLLLLLLLLFPRVTGWLQPAPAQWAGMEQLIQVAKAKKGLSGAACIGEGKRALTCFAESGSHLTALRLSKQGTVWFAGDSNKPTEKSLQVNPEQIPLETFREKQSRKHCFVSD